MSKQLELVMGGGKLRYQDFTASGTFTPNASLLAKGGQCLVILIGGGGAGGGGTSANNGDASGGNAGQYIEKYVTVSGAVTVTIGAGGTGVANATGNSGSNSTFGALLTALGGEGGVKSGNVWSNLGGRGVELSHYQTNANNSAGVIDARGGVGRNGKAGGGGGQTNPLSGAAHMSGKDGGTSAAASPTNATANSGGGGGASTTAGVAGANGGSGWCRVIWTE